jgi:hypothetical protein
MNCAKCGKPIPPGAVRWPPCRKPRHVVIVKPPPTTRGARWLFLRDLRLLMRSGVTLRLLLVSALTANADDE